jgi:tetratricopeptide (TPR) repeat protein
MPKTNVGAIRTRLFSGTSGAPDQEAILDVLEPYFDETETVQFRLQGTSGLVHEADGEEETIPVASNGGSLVVVTDQQLLFTVVSPDDETVVDVHFDDVHSIDLDDGLLRSTLTVDVWHAGTYRIKTKDSTSTSEAVAYMDEAVDTWQYARSLLEEGEKHVPKLGDHIESGRLGDARYAREEAREKYKQAKQVAENADIETSPVLRQRVEEAATELARTEIHARLARAKTLLAEAKHQTDARAYTGAFERYWTARDHLENAIMLSRQADIEEPAVLQAGLHSLDDRIENLRVRPLALAKQARERAQTTENLDAEVEALQDAFEHYRDALTAGWGTDFQFAGDEQHIRFQIEIVVGELVDKRCELAQSHIEAGDEYRERGDQRSATRQYGMALEQLDAAESLAREFQAGDVDTIDEMHDQVEWRLE